MPGTLFVVATPIGNLEDISARALRILREASLIAAEDTRRTAHLLARYAIKTPTTSLHEHVEAKKSAALLARLQRGDNVALVSDAGTPTISDPGQRLIRDAIDAGIKVEAIPGPSAVVAALAASGFPADTFTFLGFPPTRSNDRDKGLADLRSAGRTVVFFEAPHRIRETLEELQRTLGDCSVAVARELTKTHEQLVKGPISEVLGGVANPRGEYTVVVDVGQIQKRSARPESLSPADILAEFGELTDQATLTRRRAVTALAKRHRLRPNEVYRAIERGKKSGE
jgi:16S rRNA (cytidine1402-2'-O)-methyltransferase